MRWGWIFLLVGFGFVMGVLNLFGISEGREWYLWIVVVLVTSLVLALKAGGKYFKHGFVTAVISALVSSLMTYVFFDTYSANNEAFRQKMSEVPEGFNMQLMFLISAPFVAGISGVVQGGLTVLLAKLLGDKSPTLPEPVPTAVDSDSQQST